MKGNEYMNNIKKENKQERVSPIAQHIYGEVFHAETSFEPVLINKFLETLAADFDLDLNQIFDDEEKVIQMLASNKKFGKKIFTGVRQGFSSLLALSYVKKDYNKSINFYQCMMYYFKELCDIEIKSLELFENIKYAPKKEESTTLVKSNLTAYLAKISQKEDANISVSIMNALLNEVNESIPGVASDLLEIEASLLSAIEKDEERKIYLAQSLFNGQIHAICQAYITEGKTKALQKYVQMIEYLSSCYNTNCDTTLFDRGRKASN